MAIGSITSNVSVSFVKASAFNLRISLKFLLRNSGVSLYQKLRSRTYIDLELRMHTSHMLIKNGAGSCVDFSLRSLKPLERCDAIVKKQ